MPAEIPGLGLTIGQSVDLFFKVGFVILAILYFIFALIVVRQVNLMTETVITEGGPILRAISILHAGLALAVVVLFIAFF